MIIARSDSWARQMPEEEWAVYRPVLEQCRASDLPVALGGGLAFSYYSGMWRNTKDMDLYMLPSDVQRGMAILTACGFEDYHSRVGYDRSWIYRGYRDGVIVDLISSMANHRAEVDRKWLAGPTVQIGGLQLRVIPVEELIFAKLYVCQRDRCDWPDLLNILHTQDSINWDHLLERVEDDWPLLSGLLCVFAWLCPTRAAELPSSVWTRLGLNLPLQGPPCENAARRIELLESRPWFVPIERTRTDAL
jgi:hypothetical protein